MKAEVTYAVRLILDGKSFYEDSDICFVKGNMKYIAHIVQIVPESKMHKACIICDNVEAYKKGKRCPECLTNDAYMTFYVEEFDKAYHTYVD